MTLNFLAKALRRKVWRVRALMPSVIPSTAEGSISIQDLSILLGCSRDDKSFLAKAKRRKALNPEKVTTEVIPTNKSPFKTILQGTFVGANLFATAASSHLDQMKSLIITIMVLCVSSLPALAQPFTEDKHYKTLATPVSNISADIVEFFWYGCPHCYRMEKKLPDWLSDKPGDFQFQQIPAVIRGSWLIHAKAYYTAKRLGILRRVHQKIFDSIHVNKNALDNEASIKSFFINQGITEAQFNDAFYSDEVKQAATRSVTLTRGLKITGTPTFLVKSKYIVTPKMAGGQAKALLVIDELLKQADEKPTLIDW